MPTPNFPDSPTLNQEYTYQGSTWIWTGQYWRVQQAPSATGNFIPAANVTYDLGSADTRWRDLYLSGNTLILGGATLSATGSAIQLPAGSTVGGTAVATSTEVAAGGGPKIASIPITGNTYVNLDDTAIDTAGGYFRILGNNFVNGCTVLVGSTPAASVSFISSSELQCQVGALSAGSYVIYVTNPDGGTAIRVNGITASATPAWVTGSTLTAGLVDVPISLQLSANSNSTVSYTLQAGSTLPAGLTLSNVGLLSGTVTGVLVDTVYTFTIVATDAELQDSPRTFSISVQAIPQIARSLRFNSADSAYLTRTPAGAGNQRTWTWSAWVKRSSTADGALFTARPLASGTPYAFFRFVSNALQYQDNSGPASVVTTALFRDLSAWYHIVLAVDTTQATGSDRVKIYVNGTLQAIAATPTYPTQNYDTAVNSTNLHYLGATSDGASAIISKFEGYMTEINFVNAQSLTPSSFGRIDPNTGTWVPVRYTGTYGTNGFYLNFANISNVTATTLGADASGNGNNWTPNNFRLAQSNVYWSRYFTYGDGSGVSNNGRTFDGTATDSGGSKNNVTQVFSPPSPISYSTLSIKYGNGGNFGQGASLYINGVFVVRAAAGGGTSYTYTTNTPGTLSNCYISGAVSGDYESNIYKIIVDGRYLTDPIHTSVCVDSPTGYGTDTGLGGEVRGNYATLNPLVGSQTNATITSGALEITTPTGGVTGKLNYGETTATIGISSGKWYWECVTLVHTNQIVAVGIESDVNCNSTDGLISAGNRYAYGPWNGQKYQGATGTAYGATYNTGDIIGVAFDSDNGTLTFYKNGVSQGVAFTGITGTYWPAVADAGGGNGTMTFNFGQRPFAYTAPSGFKALCTQNLPAPNVGVGTSNLASNYFDTVLYTGNGAARTITGLNFEPDLVWIKQRSGSATAHVLQDIVRGANRHLTSNATDAEVDSGQYGGGVTAFGANSFSVGTWGAVNSNSQTYVAWSWNAGTANVTNTAGSITSIVRANPTAGFSIVTYTGTNGSGTVGHGLNAIPEFIIVKTSNNVDNWLVYHGALGGTKKLNLNLTDTATTTSSPWNNTNPTSFVFTVNNPSSGWTNNLGWNYVAYCFAAIPGFSAFGSYTGNGSADGPFVYLGFKPRWLLIRRSDTTENWNITDTARDPFNIVSLELYPNLTNVESGSAASYRDFLSNGFKIRGTGGGFNTNGGTYIYAAFAETPFKYTRSR